MKKFVISVIISVFIVFIVDIIFYTIDVYNVNRLLEKKGLSFRYKWQYSIITKSRTLEDVLNSDFREPINLKSKKSPIIIFGCSYAYGENLNADENLGANLAKLTNRPVYNFGISGFGVQHFLALLKNKDFSDIKNPEYIVYVYIHDHIRRMYSKYFEFLDKMLYFRYVYKNGDFVEDFKNDFNLYLYRKSHVVYVKNLIDNPKNYDKNFLMLSKYLERANLLIKKRFPNAKFIIYVYEDSDNYNWKIIENMGIKVVKNSDLSKVKSMKMSDGHPSAEAWKYYTPIFIKEAGIK